MLVYWITIAFGVAVIGYVIIAARGIAGDIERDDREARNGGDRRRAEEQMRQLEEDMRRWKEARENA